MALKQIRPDEEDADTAERFVREAQAAARLRHPNIVGVYEAGIIEGHHYLTAEYIEAKTLRDLMVAQPLAPKKAIELVSQVAEALAYAHEQGIVHRDVKPENILVDAQGRAFVMDFGLAKDVREELGRNLTVSGATLGTPAYMSPEQVRGWKEAIGPPTDQFALGVVFYELLTGRLPFDATSWPDLSKAIVETDPIRPTRVNPRLHRDLETICLKALEKDPLRRYDSMSALASDLSRWLEGEPIAARPLSLAARMWRRAARNRRVAVPIAAVLAVTLVWTAVVVIQGRRRRRVEDEASRLLEEGRRPLEEAQVYLYHEGANYDEMRKHVEEGKRLIEQALAKAPDNTLGHDLLGRAWELLGWDEKAESSYRDAIRIDPQLGVAHYHLGMLLLNRAIITKAGATPRHVGGTLRDVHSDAGQEQRALAFVQQAGPELAFAARISWIGEDEQSRCFLPIALAFVRGQSGEVARSSLEAASRFGGSPGCERFYLLAARSQEDKRCRDALDHAVGICPGYAGARTYRALMRIRAGDLEGAIADCTVAIAVNPRLASAFIDRGLAFAYKGDPAHAILDYNQALILDPRETKALLDRAVARETTGDIEGAVADYDEALAVDPRFVDALVNRGASRTRKFNAEGAISDCNQALALDPQCTDALVNRASAREVQGDLEGAISDCNQALAIDSHCASAFADRGTARRRKGDVDGAIRDLNQALAIDPRLVTAYCNRGSAFREEGDLARARADYEQALAIDPNHSNAYVGLGNLREDEGNLDGAIADFNKALDLNPTEAGAYAGRGIARRSKGDQDGALADFNHALQIDPRRLPAWLGRALVRWAKGDLDGAMQDLNPAIAIDSGYVSAITVRGLVRQAKGDLDGAIQDFTQASKIHPRDPEALSNLGDARNAMGDLDGAIADYAKALEVAPANWPYRKRVEETLRAAREKRGK